MSHYDPKFTKLDEIRKQKGIHFAHQLVGEAEGAIPNGTRIEKCNTETSDSLADGSQGTIVSSLDLDFVERPGEFLYCVEWDAYPNVPVHIHSRRIRRIESE